MDNISRPVRFRKFFHSNPKDLFSFFMFVFSSFYIDYKSNISLKEISCMHTESPSTPARNTFQQIDTFHDCVFSATAINFRLLRQNLFHVISNFHFDLFEVFRPPPHHMINQSACGMHHEIKLNL